MNFEQYELLRFTILLVHTLNNEPLKALVYGCVTSVDMMKITTKQLVLYTRTVYLTNMNNALYCSILMRFI